MRIKKHNPRIGNVYYKVTSKNNPYYGWHFDTIEQAQAFVAAHKEIA
jgi:hypothetical protein